ncbi:MAG TPA: hypothetical protein VN689_04365 [Burkholderiales bacterium]|nr:hypothetical protein [Burkholderiales bacterium]
MNLLNKNLSVTGLLLAVVIVGDVATARAGTPTAPSRWATLEAIHQLENPHNVTTPGRFGELGAYQFRPSTWRMHTSIPFERALERKISDEVAIKHYEWLKSRLVSAGLPATCYNIALAWNGGVDAVVRGQAPAVAHDYAERASNTAVRLNGRAVASLH